MSIADKFEIIADEVYEKGYQKGKAEASGDSWYDTFWDAYQQNGTRKDYQQAFRGIGWRGATFKPKYPMTVTRGSYFLYASGVQADPIDLIALEEQGITIDFSGSTNIEAAFSQSPSLVTVGTIDLSGITGNANSVFSTSRNLRRIKLLRVHSAITGYSSAFKNCDSLEDMKVEGDLSASVDFAQSAKLNTKSIVSIIEALDNSKTGQTLTLSKTAVNAMVFPFTSEQSGSTYSDWDLLIGQKYNWTISLV